MTGDRVEAAAKAIDKELADSATGPLYIGHLDFFPERAAREALAAVDECDRVAGVVRTRADVLAELREYADEWAAQPNLYSPAHASGVLAAALDRLAAAGAQPPPEGDHG